jgi:hypothetical protein
MSSMTSRCTARVAMHVNRTAQRFDFADPPLVVRVDTDYGPNASTPTWVKGGEGLTLSAGKLPMSCCNGFPRNLRHVTQRLMREATSRLAPTIQNPAERSAPSVKLRP